jgi:hypothetical protein
MLTHTDIHYLVGLLSLSFGSENVDVTLGDMVDDVAADEPRDVDITVTTRAKDGRVTAYHGIEVKDHGRPLDTTHVEQLCRKFGDMPALTSHAIVSASGYTKPAILKARHHGVALWSLRKWEDPMKGFDHVAFPKDLPMITRWFNPEGQHNIAFRRVDRLEGGLISGDMVVRMLDGTDHPTLSTVGAWANHLVFAAMNRITSDPAFEPQLSAVTKGQALRVGPVTVNFNQPLLFGDGDAAFAVDGAFVSTDIVCHEAETTYDYRILTEVGSEEPYAGCGIAVMPMGNLVALHTDKVTKKISVLNVPASDRAKKAVEIRNQKLSKKR